MNGNFVRLEIGTVAGAVVAVGAVIRLLARVDPHVLLQVELESGTIGTNWTGKRLHVRM